MGFLTLSAEEIQKVKGWQQRGITIMWTDAGGTHFFKRNQDSYMKGRIFWTDSQLRDIWENAGVHVYMNTGDVFYIGRNWLCIHTVVGGKKTIHFPFSTEVINPLENRKIAGFTKEIEINMPSKSTILLRLNPR
jgi:beta-galactosidase